MGERVFIDGVDARHLAGALRARPGERVQVVEPEGRLLIVELVAVGRDAVSGRVVEESPYDPEPPVAIWLAVAMLPASALEVVLSRGVEVGAAGFKLVAAGRSVARGARPERWAAISREAAMLAGRLRVPAVEGPFSLAEAWAGSPDPYLLDRTARQPLAVLRLERPATLFIGPEGGWTPEERALAGPRALSLGPRNLRAETAALVALAQALAGR